MKLNYVFKHLDVSDPLVEHTKDRLMKLERISFKVEQAHVIFSKVRHEFRAEVVMRAKDGVFKASGAAESLYAAVDMCAKKLNDQYTRKRKKIKNHKRRFLSQNPEEQHETINDWSSESYRKAA